MKHQVAIEVDTDDGVHPESVNTTAFLDLSGAWFGLLSVVAKRMDLPLVFTGLKVRDKCAQVVANVGNLAHADQVHAATLALLAGEVEFDRTSQAVSRFREAHRKLPEGYRVRLRLGDMLLPAAVSETFSEPPTPALVRETLRAKPIRVGGKRPKVHFESTMDGAFTVSTSKALATQLGSHLYEWVNIEVSLKRLRSGAIVDGTLHAFESLLEGSAFELWSSWSQAELPKSAEGGVERERLRD